MCLVPSQSSTMESRRRQPNSAAAGEDPSWYQYYAPSGQPAEGLVAEGDHFTLNGQEFQVSFLSQNSLPQGTNSTTGDRFCMCLSTE